MALDGGTWFTSVSTGRIAGQRPGIDRLAHGLRRPANPVSIHL